MPGAGALSQWENSCMSKAMFWAVPAMCCTSLLLLSSEWDQKERGGRELGTDMCLETRYPGSLANLTQGWGGHWENENTPQRCLHVGGRVQVLRAEINQSMIFDWIQCVANNLTKKRKKNQTPHRPKTPQKTKNKTLEKSEIYFLGYSL